MHVSATRVLDNTIGNPTDIKSEKSRSTSSQNYNIKRDKIRGKLRAKLKAKVELGNHPNRNDLREVEFESLRAELSQRFGIPKDSRLYFLKKHDLKSLPTKRRLRISFGNSVLLDADTWKVLQVNRFITFADMENEKREDMDFVIQTLYQHTLARGKVEINGSVQGLIDWGEMRTAGFRPGSDKGHKMGVTALNAKTGKSKELIFEDQERMLDLALINETLAEWMSSLCMHAFKSHQNLAIKYEIPSFSDEEWSKSPNANIFASSVVVTRDGFNNNPHFDRDVTAYTYAIFTRIERATGKLHRVETSDYLGDTTGTYFILDEYHVELALDLCDGVIESIWASDEIHHTSPSTTYDEGCISIAPKDSPITRFGCSLQINEALLNRIEGLLSMREGKTNQEWELYKQKVVKCYRQEIDFKLKRL